MLLLSHHFRSLIPGTNTSDVKGRQRRERGRKREKCFSSVVFQEGGVYLDDEIRHHYHFVRVDFNWWLKVIKSINREQIY